MTTMYVEHAYTELKRQWEALKQSGPSRKSLEDAQKAVDATLKKVVGMYYDPATFPDLDRKGAWTELRHIAEVALEVEKAVFDAQD